MSERGLRATPAARGATLVVGLLLALGLGLRVAALDLGWFGVDQARDVATALDVVHGETLPTVGPTMRRVVRLGALYYYVWAVPYLLWDDPLAGYWFAALLGTAAMVLVWRLARRLWGVPAGVVALAVVAAHPIWVLDTRVAWAPAALPAAGASILWLALARPDAVPSARRAAAIGALLGLAVQLHLTMIAWVGAAVAVALRERFPWRTVRGALAGGLATGLPALWAAVAPTGGDGGIGALAARGGAPAIGARLQAVFALPWRLPQALSGGAEPEAGVVLAGAVVSTVTLAGLIRLAVGETRSGRRAGVGARHPRAARLVLAVVVIGGGLVLCLPGEVWYYYLDALLPAAALAAGALVAPGVREGEGPRVRWRWARAAVVVGVVAAALVLAAHLGGWLRSVAARDYVTVAPALLTLDGRPGRDALTPGRLLTVRAKRAVARALAGAGGPLERVWWRLHGGALGDALGDNGFWLRWALAQPTARAVPEPGGGSRHVALWYRTDPVAIGLTRATRESAADAAPAHDVESTAIRAGAGGATPDEPTIAAADQVDVAAVGPLVVVRYEPAIDYASCRADGVPVVVPIRVLPHPRRYGDGTPRRPPAPPRRVVCRLAPGTGSTRVVAALDGPGTVRVRAGGGAAPPGVESALCVARGDAPTEVTVETEVPTGALAGLDLYDVPLGVGCEDGVAPAARSSERDGWREAYPPGRQIAALFRPVL